MLIDRKVRFRVKPKVNVALKFLREQLVALLASQYRGKPLLEPQMMWNDIAMAVLGKAKSSGEGTEKRQDVMTLVVNRALS